MNSHPVPKLSYGSKSTNPSIPIAMLGTVTEKGPATETNIIQCHFSRPQTCPTPLLSSKVCGNWPEGGQDAGDGVGLSQQESIACDSDSTGSEGRLIQETS